MHMCGCDHHDVTGRLKGTAWENVPAPFLTGLLSGHSSCINTCRRPTRMSRGNFPCLQTRRMHTSALETASVYGYCLQALPLSLDGCCTCASVKRSMAPLDMAACIHGAKACYPVLRRYRLARLRISSSTMAWSGASSTGRYRSASRTWPGVWRWTRCGGTNVMTHFISSMLSLLAICWRGHTMGKLHWIMRLDTSTGVAWRGTRVIAAHHIMWWWPSRMRLVRDDVGLASPIAMHACVRACIWTGQEGRRRPYACVRHLHHGPGPQPLPTHLRAYGLWVHRERPAATEDWSALNRLLLATAVPACLLCISTCAALPCTCRMPCMALAAAVASTLCAYSTSCCCLL